jgi:hypothetical protein
MGFAMFVVVVVVVAGIVALRYKPKPSIELNK